MGGCESSEEIKIKVSRYSKKEDINDSYCLTQHVISNRKNGLIQLAKSSSGKVYAVKTLNKRKSSVFKLRNETDLSFNLKHENIARYYDVYETEASVNIVMEFFDNGDLYDYIINSPNRRLSVNTSVNFLYQILKVLTYLHESKKIIHCDIKPENFIVVPQPERSTPILKLIDFGSCCSTEYSAEYTGTEEYSPPECYTSSNFDEKADVWSAGLTFINCVTGAHPFNSSTSAQELREEILNKNIDLSFIENCQLRYLIEQMLQKNPLERISSKDAYKYIKCMYKI